MKENNITKSSKSILILSILVLAIISGGLFLPQILAEHGEDPPGVTKTLDANSPNTVGFRSLDDNPQISDLTVDFSEVNLGFFTISVEEPDANLDPSAIDVTQDATAKSDTSGLLEATTTMTETGPDTGFFTGTIQLSTETTTGNVLQVSEDDGITVTYEQELLGVQRFEADLNVINAGDIRIANTDSDGTTVVGGDADDGDTLEVLPSTVKFVDLDSSTTFTAGEAIYDDVDGSGTVNAGDIRIANTGSDGTTVAGGDADDDGAPLTDFDRPPKYVDLDSSTTFTAGEAIYDDVDGSGTVNTSDGVKMTDVRINFNDALNDDMTPVTQSLKIKLLGGATVDATVDNAPVITISYANAVWRGDIRIANTASDGIPIGPLGDADDDGASLVAFASTPKYVDADSSDAFTVGEAIYDDVDSSGTVNPGDIRIANTDSDGTTVVGGDADEGDTLEVLPSTVKFVDSDSSTTFTAGEAIYDDAVAGGTRNSNPTDIPGNLNMYYKRPGVPIPEFGGAPFPGAGGFGWKIIRNFDFADMATHDPVAKTITSDVANTEFGGNTGLTAQQIFEDFVLVPGFTPVPITEAQFALGFPGTIGGGGSGGLVSPGVVANIVVGAGIFSSFFSGGDGAIGGGGGAGPSAPTIFSSTLSLQGNPSFTQLGEGSGSSRGILDKNLAESSEPILIRPNESVAFSFGIYENQGRNNFEHATFYLFIGDDTALQKYGTDVTKSDASIMFDKRKSVHVVDPHGYFANADFELGQRDTWNLELNYDITFAKPFDTASILIRTWDHDKNTSDKILLNAIKVVEPSFLDTPNEISTPQETVTPTELADIPIWVKNNAMWWQQKQIDDSDFVSGIEYLIKENIITIPVTQTTGAVAEEIPSWISDVAGFWAHDAISDAEFVQAMQWLISNGVMMV